MKRDLPTPKNRAAAAFVAWTLRHGRALWIAALIAAVPATWRTASLYAHLQSGLEELLPRESPSVAALDELRLRLGGHQFLGVVVDAGQEENLPAAERFLDALAARVRDYPPSEVAAVRTGRAEERAFLEQLGPLYLDVQDLVQIRDHLAERHRYEVSRAMGTLLEGEEPPAPLDLPALEAKYRTRYQLGTSVAAERFSDRAERASVLLIELSELSTGPAAGQRLIARVEDDVRALGGLDAYAPGMRLGYAGDAAISAEELSALVSDLSISSIVVLCAVIVAIISFYRWRRSVIAVGAPLLLAAVYSFSLASIPPFGVTALNSNTAFLGSIVIGNGINAGIILLARYVEERRRGVQVRASLERAISGARLGTLAASIAAGVAYASLAATQFRGFRQFGFIGALGMVLAWALSFLLMPPLLAWLDRGEGARPRPLPPGRSQLGEKVASLVQRAPAAIAMITALFTAVAVIEVAQFRTGDLEHDFSRLRRRDTWTRGEGYWGEKLNAVVGEYLTPLVLLTDAPEDARRLARHLRGMLDRPPFAGRIEAVRTVDDLLPAQQEAKLPVLRDIRHELTPKVRRALPPEARAIADRWISSELRSVAAADLPRSLRVGFMERGGHYGRIVLVYPNAKSSFWNGNEMHALVSELRRAGRDAVHGASPARLAGALPLSSDIVDAIRVDGPIASTLALIGVMLTVVVLLRRRRPILYVAGGLILGVLWMAAATRLLGVRINFSNFIAFPITFGIGVDYAVNLISRYEEDGARDILRAIPSTGAASALCSLTTIIGYSSLLLAENQALFNFGLLAVLGELSCLAAALVCLPALVRWSEQRRSQKESEDEAAGDVHAKSGSFFSDRSA